MVNFNANPIVTCELFYHWKCNAFCSIRRYYQVTRTKRNSHLLFENVYTFRTMECVGGYLRTYPNVSYSIRFKHTYVSRERNPISYCTSFTSMIRFLKTCIVLAESNISLKTKGWYYEILFYFQCLYVILMYVVGSVSSAQIFQTELKPNTNMYLKIY